MSRYDAISSATILLISLAIAVFSTNYPLGSLSKPGPGFIPFWCGVIMACLSSVLMVRALLEKRKKVLEEEKEPFFTNRWTKGALVLVALFAYSFLLELVGFFAANFITIFFLLKAVESEKWSVALLEAAVGAIGTYYLFDIWLKLNLPKGALIEILFK
jgi:hypothetical protein